MKGDLVEKRKDSQLINQKSIIVFKKKGKNNTTQNHPSRVPIADNFIVWHYNFYKNLFKEHRWVDLQLNKVG